MRVALFGWQGSSQRPTRGVITSPHWAWNWTLCPLESPRTGWDAAPPFIRRTAYRGKVSETDKVKALLRPVINWFASQARYEGGGWRMTLRGHEKDEEVTNTVQERRDCADKNILG